MWKIGGKVFAVVGWHESDAAVSFKVSPMAYNILEAGPGTRPAPYLASRGMSWIQDFGGLSRESLEAHLRASYDLVAAGLTRKARKALGILDVQDPSTGVNGD